jgi:hypothetical protein
MEVIPSMAKKYNLKTVTVTVFLFYPALTTGRTSAFPGFRALSYNLKANVSGNHRMGQCAD